MLSRFDFLFYQFSFSNRPDPQPHIEFFFIPEWEIPDIFYETLSVEESFERLNFAKYRIVMDKNGDWVRRMLQTILENPQPRQAAPRPLRLAYIQDVLDTTTLSVDSTAHVSESCVPATQQSHGRHLYKEIMTHSHRQFYDNVMRQCAERYVLLHMTDSSTDTRLDADAPASYFSLLRSILQATSDSVGTNGSCKNSRTFSTRRQIHHQRPSTNYLRTYKAFPSPTIPEILSAPLLAQT
jgi:hypothetical protein